MKAIMYEEERNILQTLVPSFFFSEGALSVVFRSSALDKAVRKIASSDGEMPSC
jgi:hypothetical protein